MKKALSIFLLSIMTAVHTMKADNYVASVAKTGATWLTMENSTVNIPAEAGDVLIKLNTNLNVTPSGRPSWATPTMPEIGVLKLAVRANTTANVRKYTMTLKAKDGKSLDINLVQLGKSAGVITNKEVLNFYGDRCIDSLEVTSNIAYTIECPEWITKEQTGENTYAFTTDKIYDQYNRKGVITFKDADGEVVKTVDIEQKYHDSFWFEKPCFAVLSDIHIGDTTYGQTHEKRFPRVLKTLNSYDPVLQALVIIGDLADHGKEEEYQKIVKYFGDSTTLNPEIKRYIVRGNHDNIDKTNGLSLYKKYIHPQEDRYFEVAGYPFIALSNDNSLYRGECYDEATYTFLKKSLADASLRYPGKPIFVFTHVLPINTIKGSYSLASGDLAAYDDHLDEIFTPYPQVVSISGHTHKAIDYPDQIHQKNYTSVNDGSQKRDSYAGYHQLGATEEIDYDAITECLIIHVNADDEVVMERWNTARCIKYDNDWVLPPPFDGTNFTYANRTGGKNPWWPETAQVTVTNKTESSCYLNFPQAIDDNEGIRDYKIWVTNSAGETVVSTFTQCALQFMGPKRPDKLVIPIDDLPKGVNLIAYVVARDYYGLSSSTLSVSFTLDK